MFTLYSYNEKNIKDMYMSLLYSKIKFLYFYSFYCVKVDCEMRR